MELSPHDSIRSPPMPNNNVIDTPRTSNLKFLRAKRLSYFCGSISQNPVLKREETQNVRQTTRTATPRRCLSAPTSNRTARDCDAPQKMNAERKSIPQNGERSLQAKEKEKPLASSSPQANLEKENLTDIPSHHTQHLPTEMETTERTAEEKSLGPNRSIPSSLQPKRSKHPVRSIHHTLPPVTKETMENILIQYDPQDPILQSCHKEDEGKGSFMNQDLLPTVKQVKDESYLPPSQMTPESDEVDVLSTHRSLLRSSFVIDLDQDLLEDMSVPETEKLHHVMTWAKKFLHKCSGGELISSSGDISLANKDEDTTFEDIQISRVTDKYVKLNSVRFDEYDLEKHPCHGEESKVSAPEQSQLLKSPTSLYKPKLKRKATQLDSVLAEPVSRFFQRDHDENDDNFLEPSGIVYPQPVKNGYVQDKGYAHSGEIFFASTKQDCIDSNDGFEYGTGRNQQHYNRNIIEKTKPDMASYREEDSSSPESRLNTQRLNSLLEDLELIEKGLEQNGKDGARTDRTFLVTKSAKSDDTSYISVSGKHSDRRRPALHRVDSNSSISEGYMRKIYQECPICGFSSASSNSWCIQCGSALKSENEQPMENNRNFELLNPQILDDNAVEEFFTASSQRKRCDNNGTSEQKAKASGRAECWEDNSDVVSDSEGSVLDKYFFYVKQLDMLRSQEKEKQTKHFQDKYTSDTSSSDESSEDCSMPRISGQAKLWGKAKTLGPDKYHFGDQPMKEKNLEEPNEDIIGAEGSSLLDRKLQKATNISSKVTGPKRYWEKSSIAWSSYTHGELKPRSKHNVQRPSSADPKNNKDELQGEKPTVNAPNEMKKMIHGENDRVNNANEYKNVAVAYLTTANAWAVSKHLCKDKWERFPQNHQRIYEGENSSMWLLLPDELWIYIFSLLSHGDLSKVAQVCQRFRYIANDDSLWKVIKVSNCHSLKDSCLVSIGLHHPESLSLYRCHDDTQTITDVGFTQLFQHCKESLKKLNITNCSGEIFKGDTILFYASNHCSRLTSVDISWTGATDKGIIALVQACVCLQSLSMNGCNITDKAITALLKQHSKRLIKLEIFGCHALTAKCLISVATECVQLDNLNIGKIPDTNDVCLAKIASNLHKIVTLNLTSLSVVRDRAVHLIVKQCSKLENLTLSSCLQVTDVSLVEISTYRTSIKYLDLSGCKKVSDIGIQALARSCQQLQYLDLSSTGTGKRGVCLLASYCYASLECLKLSFCKEVTVDAIEKLCKTCKRLKVLHLYGCRLSPDLGYIKKLGKSLQILHDLSISTANILGK